MQKNSAILQLALAALAALTALSCTASLFILGLFQRSTAIPGAEDATPTFLWVVGSGVIALLVLPFIWHTWRFLQDKPRLAQPNLGRFAWPIWGLALAPVLAAALYMGNWVVTESSLSWLLLPPLHLLVIGIPIVWLAGVAIHGLYSGSPRRFWGVFSAGLLLSPTLIMIIEMGLLFLAGIAVVVYIASQPNLAQEIETLAERLYYSGGSETAVGRILEPYLRSPALLLSILVFAALLVPLIEETIKPIGVWLLGRRRLTPTNGFAIGALSGAGYAFTESILLVSAGESWASVLIGRIGTSTLHIFTTALVGWGLALAWSERRYLRLGVHFACAVLLHALWNSLAVLGVVAELYESTTGGETWTAIISAATSMGLPIMFILCLSLLVWFSRRLRQQNSERNIENNGFDLTVN